MIFANLLKKLSEKYQKKKLCDEVVINQFDILLFRYFCFGSLFQYLPPHRHKVSLENNSTTLSLDM